MPPKLVVYLSRLAHTKFATTKPRHMNPVIYNKMISSFISFGFFYAFGDF